MNIKEIKKHDLIMIALETSINALMQSNTPNDIENAYYVALSFLEKSND